MHLRLLDIEEQHDTLRGLKMELEDCAHPLVYSISYGNNEMCDFFLFIFSITYYFVLNIKNKLPVTTLFSIPSFYIFLESINVIIHFTTTQKGIDARECLQNVDIAIYCGGQGRRPGMDQSDLIRENYQIFASLGKILNEVAAPNSKHLVVANPVIISHYLKAIALFFLHHRPTQIATL